MEEHLRGELNGRADGNKRNGRGKKTVKSIFEKVEIETPQDRNSSFEPQIVEKRHHILSDSLEKQIIGMYGLGTSLRDIQEHISEM